MVQIALRRDVVEVEQVGIRRIGKSRSAAKKDHKPADPQSGHERDVVGGAQVWAAV